jgi:hypothetical protein
MNRYLSMRLARADLKLFADIRCAGGADLIE